MHNRDITISLLVLGSAVFLTSNLASAQVLPPHSIVEGRSIGEWTGDWWAWVVSVPTPDDPLTDTTGANANNGQPGGPVFFVAGTTTGGVPVERTFTVPAGKYLLVPLINGICCQNCGDPFETEEEMRECAREFVDAADSLQATLDDVFMAPQQNLWVPQRCFLAPRAVPLAVSAPVRVFQKVPRFDSRFGWRT